MSDYNHDRDWEIAPDERSDRRRQHHLGPPPDDTSTTTNTLPTGTTATAQRRTRTQPRTQPSSQRRHQDPAEDENEDQDSSPSPSLLGQLLGAIFRPLIGFIVIALVSLTWSGLLFAALMIYVNLGFEFTFTTLAISMFTWIIGMSALYKVLLRP